MSVSAVILTFNSEATIAATLTSAFLVSDDVHVVDSGSTDHTLQIVEQAGARVVHHAFERYDLQRNWAIQNLELRHAWELHLDADERLSRELVAEIRRVTGTSASDGVTGYFIPRLVHFHGRPLLHGGMYPIYHMRLVRRGQGRCETRKYDQHFIADGPCARLNAPMIDDIRLSLSEWTTRHNRWADAEVDELLEPGPASIKSGKGNPIANQRRLKEFYYRQPLFLRPLMLFLYRYLLKRGFLDGPEGLIFYVLQTFWFRFLVDAKLYERRHIATISSR